MKLQNIFLIFICFILVSVSWHLSNKYTTKKFESQIAELNKYHNDQTILANTEKLKGEAIFKEQIKKIVEFYQDEISKLNYDLGHMHQEQEQTIIPWDEYVDFVPDPIPDIEPIIIEVIKQVEVTDSCRYSYVDANNGYRLKFNIRYDSKPRLFTIVPHSIVFANQKPIIRKRTTVGVVYLANNSGGVIVQYDILPFINIGGVAGWAEEPLVGVCIGYRF